MVQRTKYMKNKGSIKNYHLTTNIFLEKSWVPEN